MDDMHKAQIVIDAASILVLHAASLKSSAAVYFSLKSLLNRLENEYPDILVDLDPEIQLLFGTLQITQKNIQKAGTAQGLFIEDVKNKFGIGEGKPTNVRKGNVRKKD